MLRRLRLILVAATAAAAAGCSLFFDAGDLGAAPDDAGDGGEQGDATEAAAPDGRGGADGAAGSDDGCPSREGPRMVRVGDFCIDSTEVTRAQYMRFVDAVGPDAGGPAGVRFCPQTNKSVAPLDPENGYPPAKESPDFPVRAIDWCDAKAYCLWAGKDLCGGLGGAAITSDDAVDPKKSQWAKACTKDGAFRFAYGDSYVGGKCVDGPAPSQPSDGKCEGGYPGIFDMVGNVAEWIDACMAAPYTNCALVGRVAGSDEIASCTSVAVPPGDVAWPDVGVRCCAPAKNTDR